MPPGDLAGVDEAKPDPEPAAEVGACHPCRRRPAPDVGAPHVGRCWANAFPPSLRRRLHATAGRGTVPVERSPQRRVKNRGAVDASARKVILRSIIPLDALPGAAPAMTMAVMSRATRSMTLRIRRYTRRVALSGKKILITGGAGFIGTTLARRLVDANDVFAFDNLHRDALSGTDLGDHPNFHFLPGDVLDLPGLTEATKGMTHIVHAAGIAGVDTVLASPVRTMRVNMIGTYNALEAALATQGTVERMVEFSTSEVFGQHAFNVGEGQVTTIGSVGEARWTYAVSKLAGEHMSHAYHAEFGLPTVSVRPFNIFGPGQIGGGAIRAFIEAALDGRDLTIHGDGSQIRAWCFVDDMVEGTLLGLEHPNAVGESFNIGNARSAVTIYDLARRIKQITGAKGEIVFTPLDYVDVELRIPNMGKARELLGFEAKVELDEGLERTIDWYRTNRPAGS